MFPCGGKKKPKKKKPTPSQLHFEAPLRTVATVFPSVYVAVLATRFGEPIARLPRETQHPVNPDFDDREFEDIPKELRDLDDKMTGQRLDWRVQGGISPGSFGYSSASGTSWLFHEDYGNHIRPRHKPVPRNGPWYGPEAEARIERRTSASEPAPQTEYLPEYTDPRYDWYL